MSELKKEELLGPDFEGRTVWTCLANPSHEFVASSSGEQIRTGNRWLGADEIQMVKSDKCPMCASGT